MADRIEWTVTDRLSWTCKLVTLVEGRPARDATEADLLAAGYVPSIMLASAQEDVRGLNTELIRAKQQLAAEKERARAIIAALGLEHDVDQGRDPVEAARSVAKSLDSALDAYSERNDARRALDEVRQQLESRLLPDESTGELPLKVLINRALGDALERDEAFAARDLAEVRQERAERALDEVRVALEKAERESADAKGLAARAEYAAKCRLAEIHDLEREADAWHLLRAAALNELDELRGKLAQCEAVYALPASPPGDETMPVSGGSDVMTAVASPAGATQKVGAHNPTTPSERALSVDDWHDARLHPSPPGECVEVWDAGNGNVFLASVGERGWVAWEPFDESERRLPFEPTHWRPLRQDEPGDNPASPPAAEPAAEGGGAEATALERAEEAFFTHPRDMVLTVAHILDHLKQQAGER